jgi:hypothetical protein
MSKEAMKLALDELKHIKQTCLSSMGISLVNEKVLIALEEALAKQEQGEPVKQQRPQNCGTSYCSCIECVMDEQEQDELVGWPCVIETADFEEDTVTLKMQSKDYSVGVGLHWLYTTLQQRTWVGLTDDDFITLCDSDLGTAGLIKATESKLKEKNT